MSGQLFKKRFSADRVNQNRNHVWGLAEDNALKALHAQGLSDPEIAARIGFERRAVLNARKRLKLPSNVRPGGCVSFAALAKRFLAWKERQK